MNDAQRYRKAFEKDENLRLIKLWRGFGYPEDRIREKLKERRPSPCTQYKVIFLVFALVVIWIALSAIMEFWMQYTGTHNCGIPHSFPRCSLLFGLTSTAAVFAVLRKYL